MWFPPAPSQFIVPRSNFYSDFCHDQFSLFLNSICMESSSMHALWLLSCNIILNGFIHVVECTSASFSYHWIKFHYEYITNYPFYRCWAFGLFKLEYSLEVLYIILMPFSPPSPPLKNPHSFSLSYTYRPSHQYQSRPASSRRSSHWYPLAPLLWAWVSWGSTFPHGWGYHPPKSYSLSSSLLAPGRERPGPS